MNSQEYTPFWGDLQRFITGRIEIDFYSGFGWFFYKLCAFGMADDCFYSLYKKRERTEKDFNHEGLEVEEKLREVFIFFFVLTSLTS
ncbi:MAG: hypothetical protein A3J37_08905 [Alphaproteobacteria bacterium RIFCSPHIGHO2_12_FULL_45_9]|nr:MAG: hypothetical protein A3B66_01825 [Alphaproteobacteria bacterium RIFCSPHIGHO2_02_FULL_46_13]OFW98644.1 MAG: hypothetical protein A3J37_08905 [Alphaproteobacteria bacterium RIFCSPHIGHO2_12_FULL_45_9]